MYRSLILEQYHVDTFSHTCINCILYPDTLNKSHLNLIKVSNKLTQAYYERKYYTMKLETSFYKVNMHKQLHTCKIKEMHNYPPTMSAIKGTQTEHLVLYFVHISYAKSYKLFTSYYVIYCTVL